jgi:hypothetical protein
MPALNIDLLDVFFCATIWLLFCGATRRLRDAGGSEVDDRLLHQQ